MVIQMVIHNIYDSFMMLIHNIQHFRTDSDGGCYNLPVSHELDQLLNLHPDVVRTAGSNGIAEKPLNKTRGKTDGF